MHLLIDVKLTKVKDKAKKEEKGGGGTIIREGQGIMPTCSVCGGKRQELVDLTALCTCPICVYSYIFSSTLDAFFFLPHTLLF